MFLNNKKKLTASNKTKQDKIMNPLLRTLEHCFVEGLQTDKADIWVQIEGHHIKITFWFGR